MQFRRLSRLLLGASLTVSTLSALAIEQTPTDPELARLLKQAIELDSGFEDRFDAQVWLLDMSQRLERYVPDAETRIEILKRVHYEATRVNIEPELVLALIEVESAFDEFAINYPSQFYGLFYFVQYPRGRRFCLVRITRLNYSRDFEISSLNF